MTLNVALTGMGVVSALGHSPVELLERLRQDALAVEEVPWTREDPDRHEWWAPIKDFDPLEWFTPHLLEGIAPFAQNAVAAADRALKDAGLADLDDLRTAIVVGTSKNGTQTMERAQFDADQRGRDGVSKKLMIQVWPNMAASQIAMRWGLHGPCLTLSTACASSLDAVGLGARLVADGVVDVALVGGTEGGLASDIGDDDFIPASAYGREAYGMGAQTHDPGLACQPFDANRAGMVFGEGAAMFVLESARHAKARGARCHGWVQGWGSIADAHHPSAPEPNGRWERRVMDLALEGAGISAQDVDVIAAHGTGTPKGDQAEIRAINGLVKGRGDEVSVMSFKGRLGHPTGSAGALSLAVTLQGMAEKQLIHTGGTTEPDPEIDFDLVLGAPRMREIEWALLNAFGFGGQNASIVVSAEQAG